VAGFEFGTICSETGGECLPLWPGIGVCTGYDSLIGNVAAILQDVPVLTQGIDLFVRDTPDNRQKIRAFAEQFGEAVWQPHELSNMLRVATPTGRRQVKVIDEPFRYGAA